MSLFIFCTQKKEAQDGGWKPRVFSIYEYIHKLTPFSHGPPCEKGYVLWGGRNYRTPTATILTYSSHLVHIHTPTPVVRTF